MCTYVSCKGFRVFTSCVVQVIVNTFPRYSVQIQHRHLPGASEVITGYCVNMCRVKVIVYICVV